MIDIKGLDKALVLKTLHDNSKAQGMSFFHLKELSLDECKQIVNERSELYFDYLHGKVMKVDISGDSFDPWGYDRDNGGGAAQKAIDSIKTNYEAIATP